MLNARRSAGFNLVELLIGISIAALLLAMAGPYYTDFMVNTQIRTVAESVADGLRTTQAYAIKRNENIEFVLDPNSASATWGWNIRDAGTATSLQQQPFVASGDKVTVTVAAPTAAERIVTFNGLGRIVNPNADASAPMQEIDVTSTAIAGTTRRNMNVITGADPARGGLKMCNPALPVADPQGCPP